MNMSFFDRLENLWIIYLQDDLSVFCFLQKMLKVTAQISMTFGGKLDYKARNE